MKRVRILCLACVFIFVSCSESVPKPSGYPRIDKLYSEQVIFDYPDFSFLYPATSKIEEVKKDDVKAEFWFNIFYPQYNATIYCTYLQTNKSSLPRLLEESYHLAYSHVLKAEGITQTQFSDSIYHTSGIIYDIKGSVAAPVQFYVTDNNSHFLRGSLYFNNEVKTDSISPVIQYIREDIVNLMESLQWK